ncbi:hypothetical protein BSKO_10689 [Bryopsis sp. KO-2023]|nr:hypothetical protein BSKO_10689 [Bryopsis sp. KO-2023]
MGRNWLRIRFRKLLEDCKVALYIYELWMLPIRISWENNELHSKSLRCFTFLDGSWTHARGFWVDICVDTLFLCDIVLTIISKIVAQEGDERETPPSSITHERSRDMGSGIKAHFVGFLEGANVRGVGKQLDKTVPRTGSSGVRRVNSHLVSSGSGNSEKRKAVERIEGLSSFPTSESHPLRGFEAIISEREASYVFKHSNDLYRKMKQSTIDLEDQRMKAVLSDKKFRVFIFWSVWVDLLVCLSIYIPTLYRSPTWVKWIASIPRTKRLVSLYQYFRARELMVHLNIRHIAFFKFLVTVVGTAHWVGCAFFVLAGWSNFEASPKKSTWMGLFLERHFSVTIPCPSEHHVLTPYFISIYKGLNGLTNLGYDIGVPEREDEMAFSIIIILVQIVLEAYILGTLVHYVVKKDANIEAFRADMSSLTTYCKVRKLPDELREKLVLYFEFQHNKKMADDEAQILRALPSSLRIQVASHQYSSIIRRNEFLFKGCNAQFLKEVMIRLREVYLMPGEVTIREGEMARELIFVLKGVVEEMYQGTTIKTVREDTQGPNMCGFSAFFIGIPQPRTLRGKDTSDVTLLVFSRLDYDELIEFYPNQQDVIMRNLLAFYELDRDGNETTSISHDEDLLAMGSMFYTERLRVKKLIQTAVKKRNADGMRSMMTMVRGPDCDAEALRMLLRSGLNIDTQDYDRRTPLHIAAKEGNSKIVEVLLAEGANPNVKDRWGHTPLQNGIKAKNSPTIKILRKDGAEMGHDDPATDLIAAVDSGDLTQLARLIENGVHPSCKDYDQKTCLHVAASQGNLSAVDYLLGHHANPNEIDGWGQTCLQVAVFAGHGTVADVIKKKGGRLSLDNPAQVSGSLNQAPPEYPINRQALANR